ncbi:MAG: TSUP family transporter [archaeon]|nr:TSUP family transporter [archaeon]
MKYVLFSYVVLFFLTLLKQSEIINSNAFLHSFIFILFLSFCVYEDMLSFTHIQREIEYRKKINFPYDDKDIVWDTKTFITVNLIGFISGLIAGIFGIGGGIIFGPLILAMEIYPKSAIVTTNFLVLITSFASVLQYMITSKINFDYTAISLIFSGFGSYIGTKLIQYFVTKTKKESLNIFCMSAVVGLSALFLPILL